MGTMGLVFNFALVAGYLVANGAVASQEECLADPLPAGALARIGTTRLRHADEVRCIALSPDSAILASGGGVLDGHKIHLWALPAGKEITWQRPADGIRSVDSLAFSPDSMKLAAIAETTVYVWDARSAARLLKFPLPEQSTMLCFAPNGRFLATGGPFNTTIRIWDPNTGKTIRTIKETLVSCIAFSPDSRTLAAGDPHGVVHLYEVATGRQVCEMTAKGLLWVSAVAFSPDGKLLAWAGNVNAVFIRELDSHSAIVSLRGHKGAIDTVSFAPDGKSVASGGWDHTIRIWNVATAREIACLRGHLGKVSSVGFSSGGRHLVSIGDSREQVIRIWDAASAQEIHPWQDHSRPVTTMAFSGDGRSIATGSQDRSIRLWRAESGKPIGLLGRHVGSVSALAFSPDDRLVASAATDLTIRLTNAGSRRVVWKAGTDTTISSLAFGGNGTTLTVLDPTPRSWEVALGGPGKSLSGPDGGVLSPDGKIQAALRYSVPSVQEICLCHTLPALEVDRFQLDPTENLAGLTFSADGSTLAVVCRAHVQRYDVPNRTEFRPFSIALDSGERVVFALSGDGMVLAIGRENGLIELWDMLSGTKIGNVGEGGEQLSCLAFGPSGRRLYSGSWDTSVLIWDLTGMLTGRNYPPVALTEAELTRLWDELAASKATTAYRAMWRLVFAWQQSPDFLANKMPMASVADSKKVRQLLSDLDDSRYVVRQRATLSLESMGPPVILPLHRTLTAAPSLEVRRRVEDILARLKQPALSRENMRASRAVRVLEQIGSPQAKHLLETLAKGGEFAWQTSEAQRALERLAKGHP